MAMMHREQGGIRMALAREAELENIYQDLPKWVR
jgi:hypothetical protein